jgi:hypothetical protein
MSVATIFRLRLHGSGHSLVQKCCVPRNAGMHCQSAINIGSRTLKISGKSPPCSRRCVLQPFSGWDSLGASARSSKKGCVPGYGVRYRKNAGSPGIPRHPGIPRLPADPASTPATRSKSAVSPQTHNTLISGFRTRAHCHSGVMSGSQAIKVSGRPPPYSRL